MRTIEKLGAALLTAVALAGCDSILGENRTPETISYQVQGSAGEPVQLVLSSQFVSGVNESGTTEVQLFIADTTDTVLPLSGTYDISVDRRFFIEVLPEDTLNTVTGRVIVNVDGRNLIDESGAFLVDPPFRFVYAFNQVTTRVIEVF